MYSFLIIKSARDYRMNFLQNFCLQEQCQNDFMNNLVIVSISLLLKYKAQNGLALQKQSWKSY
jgi:hypothetical protein